MLGQSLVFARIQPGLAQDPAASNVFGFLTITCLIAVGVIVVMLLAEWKIFQKAGEPGWACLVPFYCNYVLFKIAFGNGWLFLLQMVPLVNFVMSVLLSFKLAKAFGKDIGYGIGLLLLGQVFYPLLAFGDAQYIGNVE